MKYSMVLLLVMVIDLTNAGNSNDDTDTDSSKSFRRTSLQKNQYYAYVNPKFTDITNRMNQRSASIRAFRNQNKMTAFSSNLNPLRSQYTKPIISYNNLIRPAVINTIQINQKHAAILNRPTTTKINKIQDVSNVNTVGIKTKTIPNRIVYTNPITGGKTIFVRNVDENTYSQHEKATNTIVQLTTPLPNNIVPLPNVYNIQTKIPSNQIPYYQINTTPVPTAASILDNYIQPATSQIHGDQSFARMNTHQSPIVRTNTIPASNLANYDLPVTTLNTQKPVERTMMNSQMQPLSTVNNRQMATEYSLNYPLPASNTIRGSQITNSLATSNTYPTRNQQTNQKYSGFQSPSNRVYTNSVNPPQPTPTNQPPTTDTGNALNFVRAFFQQLMQQQQQPPKNQYKIATSPTSKYNM
ncbi:hypothetical protein LOTGIDRAFT_157065 [Lottia gigantea]|uniref:Uncharacterized protein n=1 Tax=Lottia gigantea TaxID=225164 RepID=V4AGC8_LOTGI|nr:hypothetical protein LOTGIDRAFT_157065 [Lottia gigantea]ESP03099.1 hypothetical protein LOTGIDRAFT_157065 [Lottia gigantea]